MFENIIGQDPVVGTLRSELAGGRLPRAVLFNGPAYSGKLSTALEAARVLTCEEGNGDWSCPCQACQAQRLLTYPYTLLLGSRYFDLEILAAADVLKRTRKSAAQYLFVRAVRKLSRRFDPILWEGEETRIKGIPALLAELEEGLEEISPGAELPDGKELEKRLEALIKTATRISAALSEDNVPIHQIRRAVYWMHLSSTSRRKILILENADRMYDASRNSLLKILEEPPEAVTLILLTTHKGGILPTIRSRLRTYEFAERGPEEVGQILTRIFQETAAPSNVSSRGPAAPSEPSLPLPVSLSEYFLSWREVRPDALQALARRFLSLVRTEGQVPDILGEMGPLFSTRSEKKAVSYLLEELVRLLHELLREGRISPRSLLAWGELVQAKHGELNRYNLNPKLVLESLFYALGEVDLEKIHPESPGQD